MAHDVGAIGDNGTMNVVVGVGKNNGGVNEILMMRVLIVRSIAVGIAMPLLSLACRCRAI